MATPPTDLSSVVRQSRSVIDTGLLEPVAGVAFWTAVALPFLHVPLLLLTGLSTPNTMTAFLVLLALNVVALLVGHSYSRE
ncbi:hypothetical protein BRC64_10200 [Halobacteriales archaeon QH_10_67_22]|jgi:hypothetical protein|nr:MAG: hypothetical protein BRC64_10200 [Halobacteriales archaeon QH_10_67_22]